jgi:hypothetical protein
MAVEVWVNTDFGTNPIPPQNWFNALTTHAGDCGPYKGFITPCVTFAQPYVYWTGATEIFRKCLTAGLKIATYARPPRTAFTGLAGLKANTWSGDGKTLASHLSWFEFDVENPNEPVSQIDLDYMMLNEGQRSVIYTDSGQFVSGMGYDPGTTFSVYPLHDSNIESGTLVCPDHMSQSPHVAYNGWSVSGNWRKIWQYITRRRSWARP